MGLLFYLEDYLNSQCSVDTTDVLGYNQLQDPKLKIGGSVHETYVTLLDSPVDFLFL